MHPTRRTPLVARRSTDTGATRPEAPSCARAATLPATPAAPSRLPARGTDTAPTGALYRSGGGGTCCAKAHGHGEPVR